MSERKRIVKGALYVAFGVATPALLLPRSPWLAIIQTCALVFVGIMNIAEGVKK